MKKLSLLVVAVATLFTTSCVTEAEEMRLGSNETLVTFDVAAPGSASRAVDINANETTTIGNGYKATELHYAIYDANWNCLKVVKDAFPANSLTKTITLRLVKNKVYNFVFWAQAPYKAEGSTVVNDFYTVSLGAVGDQNVTPSVKVNYNNDLANNDYRDAFYGKLLAFKAEVGVNPGTVTLSRPFAQVNFGINDYKEAEEMGYDITKAQTSVELSVYDTLNLRSDEVSLSDPTKTTTVFALAALPENTTLKTADKGDFYWVSMNYILWPNATAPNYISLTTCKMTVKMAGQNDIVVDVQSGAPANRNFRTNLVGSLLTAEKIFTVEITPATLNDFPTQEIQ